MKVSIGDNNKINKSVIGERNKVVPAESGSITKEVIIDIIVTVIGGILLTLALAVLGLSNQ